MANNDSQHPEGEVGDDGDKQPTFEAPNTEAAASTASSTDAEVKTLASALQDAKLNVQKWSDHLKTDCGVTEYEQLKYLDDTAFPKLQRHVGKNMWEINALKKLLGIGERYDPNHASKAETAKQQAESKAEIDEKRAEKARAFLKEMGDAAKGEKDHTDAVVNEKMKRLREALQIHDDRWINKSNDQTIDSVTEKIVGQLRNGEQLETDRKKLLPRELLEQASGGSAMRGILVTNNLEDCIDTRRIVLEVPDVVQLRSPISSQKEDMVEFSSKEQSDNFSRSLETMGYSMAASVKGGFWMFQTEAGGAKSHEEETAKDTESHDGKIYLSRLLYFYVPTAICELQEHKLKLHEDALETLRELETIIRFGDSEDMKERKCQNFLRTYGSHVNVGHVEFGGIYQWESTFHGKTESDTVKIQSLVQDGLSAHVSASYGIPGVGLSVGGSFSGSKETGKGTGTGSHKLSDISSTTLKTDKKGGPQEVSDPVRWKTGIMKYNETWAVIDRGHREEERVAIWKIIERNHTGEFADVSKLSKKLQNAWKSLGGQDPTDDCREILNIKRTMDEILSEVHEWQYDASLSVNAAVYLKSISQKIDIRSALTEEILAQTLQNNNLSKFLERCMEIKDEYSAKDLQQVQHYLQVLLKETGKHEFTLRNPITLWLKY